MRTRNFTLEEVIHSPIEYFPETLMPIAFHAMARAQGLREYLGAALIVTSGYRSPERNRNAGGAENSYHIWRFSEEDKPIWALDVYSPEVALSDIYREAVKLFQGEVYLNSGEGIVHFCDYGVNEEWKQ